MLYGYASLTPGVDRGDAVGARVGDAKKLVFKKKPS